MKRTHRLILAGSCSLALGIGLAACGGSDSSAATTGTPAGNTSSSGGSGGGRLLRGQRTGERQGSGGMGY